MKNTASCSKYQMASVGARSRSEEYQLSRATAQCSQPQWVERESLTLSACIKRHCRREFYMLEVNVALCLPGTSHVCCASQPEEVTERI